MSEEEKNETPAWIVSFSDMVTLLLAFFVLLQAFAEERSPDLFYEGQGSFRRAIKGLGIPNWLYGKRHRIEREWIINRHPAPADPENKVNRPIIDAEKERMAQIFHELKKRRETQSDNMMHAIRVEATPIRFPDGSATLTDEARSYLDSLIVDLQNNRNTGDSAVYLIALAPDVPPSRKRWLVSTERARSVELYLRSKLGNQQNTWPLRSWGSAGDFGDIPEGTQMAVVILGAEYGR